jgi:hypothetical protein
MFKMIMISAAALGLAAPAAAFAQDYGWYQHQRDHAEHGSFHDEADDAHREAHERGFNSRAEHEGYHRGIEQMHEEFHDDHPGTRHDGYRLPRDRRSYNGYQRYQPSYDYSGSDYSPYGYSTYGYSPYGYSPYSAYGYSPYGNSPYNNSSVTLSFGW